MDIILFRLVHIVSGAFWFGAALTMFLFLQPTAQATAPEGQKFMLHLLRNRRLSEVVLAAALLNVGAGSILFWRNSGGLQLTRMLEPSMLGFTVGAAAAWVALLIFVFVGYPTGRRMVAVGDRLERETRPPTEEEQRTLATSQRTLKAVGITVLILLSVAIASMATARYWVLVL